MVDLTSLFCIPKSYEVYLTESFRFHCDICYAASGNVFHCFHYSKIRSIDSINFLGASLASLAEELVNSCHNMIDMKRELAPLWEFVTDEWHDKSLDRQEEIFLLLQRKQYFPYTYIKDTEVLSEKCLPEFEFWNKGFQLGAEISEENYQTAINVFQELECENIDSYLTYYLYVDVLLLSSIFESWRRLGMNEFGLDMANHISLPQFGMSSWLYTSGASIDLLQDYEQILRFESAKRG